MRKKLRALIIGIQRTVLYRKWFGSHLRRNIVYNWTLKREDHCLSAIKKNRVIGSLYLSPVHDEHREGWLITLLQVNRMYRHVGIGKQLLIRVSDYVSYGTPCKIYAYALTEYRDIIEFYEDSGFAVDSEMKMPDENGELTPMSKMSFATTRE